MAYKSIFIVVSLGGRGGLRMHSNLVLEYCKTVHCIVPHVVSVCLLQNATLLSAFYDRQMDFIFRVSIF